MTAPDRIYRGVTVGGRVVYQDSPPSDDQLVWPWEAYTRSTPLVEALAVPEVIAGRSLSEWAEFARRDDCLDRMVPSDLRQLVAALRAIGEGRNG